MNTLSAHFRGPHIQLGKSGDGEGKAEKIIRYIVCQMVICSKENKNQGKVGSARRVKKSCQRKGSRRGDILTVDLIKVKHYLLIRIEILVGFFINLQIYICELYNQREHQGESEIIFSRY